MSEVSTGHVELTTPEEIAAARSLEEAWTEPEIARQQRALADVELEKWGRGVDVAPFTAYYEMFRKHCWDEACLLDVGSGSGYYNSVLKARDWQGKYYGVDYSVEMVTISWEREKGAHFKVGDARAVPYGTGSFPVVVSGCAMLHIMDWRKAVEEAARVSRRWVMLHKTPVVSTPTRFYRKLAYGFPCVEIHFGEAELRLFLDEVGLRWIDEYGCSTMTDGRWTTIMLEKK